MKKVIFSLFIFCCNFLLFEKINGQVFYPDDPIWEAPDQLNMPPPTEYPHSEFFDFYEQTFLFPGKKNHGPALNVNTLGEVPNSSWYTNRHYRYPMSKTELLSGPDKINGPFGEGKWIITSGKSQGITPGFQIEDKNGDKFLIKFDPPSNPEMATGAEIICTKFFYALGYHTPENYLIKFKPDQLELSPDATTKDALGRKKPLTQLKVNEMLSKAHLSENGYYRVIASKFINGKPIGPFNYAGTRPDDANDIYPHESLRELRGLRIFCAWLNHDDSRAINTNDFLMNENGNIFVRHYLLDFGSTLGSGSVIAQGFRAGNEYILEGKSILKGIFTFGLWTRPWAKIEYPAYPAIGRIEGDYFDPVKWKTEYPNPAFLNCDLADAFWAAKKIMNFTDDEIKAIVSLADFSNSKAEDYLVETLIKRRNKIGEKYLFFSGGLDRFQIKVNKLTFENLLIKHKLINSKAMRKITWHEFDNLNDSIGKLLFETESDQLALSIPESNEDFLVVNIKTNQMRTCQVFIRNISEGKKVVGIRRK